MGSILLRYENGAIQTTKLRGHLRSIAWDTTDQYIIIVGNRGRVLRIKNEEVATYNSGTRQNLRAVSWNPADRTALIVGNEGTIVLLDERWNPARIDSLTNENLRTVAWNDTGSRALIAGNRGTLLKYSNGAVESIDCGGANLRRISWRPKSEQALITSNCFAEEFIPSPNLFLLDAQSGITRPVNEGRADFIGVDWKSTGDSALIVGYDVVWHNGFMGDFNGTTLRPVQFENKRVYPVAVSWKPSGELAALATATAQPGMGSGSIYLWDGKSLTPIFTTDEFYFSAVKWNRMGTRFAALASSSTRTFNC